MKLPLLGFLTAAGLASPVLADSPKVVTDIAPIHSLVSQVMQGVGEPALLIQANVSPHNYSMRPSEARALQNADAVFWVGPELSPGLGEAIAKVSNADYMVELLEVAGISKFEFRDLDDFIANATDAHDHDDHDDHGHEEHDEHNHDDHSDDKHEGHDDHDEDAHDHAHDGVDPHAWLDPSNGQVWLAEIARVLSEIDPDNANTYAANAQAAQGELDVLITTSKEKLGEIHDARFVVFHDAYQYFEKRFDVVAYGALLDSDAASPSASRLSQIRDTLKSQHVHCVFSEPQFNDDIIASITEGLDVRVEKLDPIGLDVEIGAGLYAQIISGLVDGFEHCLEEGDHAHDH